MTPTQLLDNHVAIEDHLTNVDWMIAELKDMLTHQSYSLQYLHPPRRNHILVIPPPTQREESPGCQKATEER